jgi:hypothetical protein
MRRRRRRRRPGTETDERYSHRARIATLTGRPYSVRADAWEPAPSFGFKTLADAVAKVILSSVPQLTLAVYGPWGSGKTTLLHAVSVRVESRTCPVIWFDMWEHKDRRDVIPYLLAAIADGLPGHPELKKKLRAFARAALASATLTAGQVSFSGDDFLKEIDKMWDDARPLGRDRLADVIRTWREQTSVNADDLGVGPRIVVVIDNLDRCLPGQAVQMLEQTSSLFDFEGIVFLLAAEHERLANAVERTYRLPNKEGARYLEKLVQVELTVPSPDPALVRSWIEEELSDAQLPLKHSDAELIAEAAEWNPRRIKRLVNNVRMQLSATRPEFANEKALALGSTLLLETDAHVWRTLTTSSEARTDAETKLGSTPEVPNEPPVYPRLVARILKSQGGQQLLSLHDDQMSRFLTSAESTIGASEDAQVREAVDQARSDPGALRRDAAVVYSGAGVGIAGAFGLAGALAVLEEDGWQPRAQAGAGAGALIAVLRACGYSAIDIAQVLDTADFASMFRQHRRVVRVLPRRRRRATDLVEEWVSVLLGGRGVQTFGDLETRGRPVTLIALFDMDDARTRFLPAEPSRIDPPAIGMRIAPLVAASLRRDGSIKVGVSPEESSRPLAPDPRVRLSDEALVGYGTPNTRTFTLKFAGGSDDAELKKTSDSIVISLGEVEPYASVLGATDRRLLASYGREAAQLSIRTSSQESP